jgi:hypothetical protein
MNVEGAQVISTGGTSIVVNQWSMTGTALDGSEVAGSGRSADANGVTTRWPLGLVLIDHS